MAKKRKAKPKEGEEERIIPGLTLMPYYRQRAGRMSQEKLASIVGVSQGMISQWEKGTSDVPLGMVHKLAQALDTTAFGLQFRHPFHQDVDIFSVWQKVPEEHRDRALRILIDFTK